jgi:hypothetical protein
MNLEFDGDYRRWILRVADHLERGEADRVDLALVGKQFRRLAFAEVEQLRTHLEGLLLALVGLEARTDSYCCRTFKNAAIERRASIMLLIEESPSLSSMLSGNVDLVWRLVRDAADHLRPDLELPERCPWRVDQILDSKFLPPRGIGQTAPSRGPGSEQDR